MNLTNATFWRKTPRGQEILEFLNGMTNCQKIEFLCCFDIFVVGFHNGINTYVAMTADPSSRNFEKTLLVSISKGYKQFSHHFSGRTTQLEDLRSSIDSSPIQPADLSTSPASGFESPSMELLFQQGLNRFGPATQPISPFQGFKGLAGGFSLFSAQPPSLGGYFQPIAQGGSTDSSALLPNFISVESTDEPIIRKGQLKIVKGRVVSVEIPSGCSSGPSTSSTVGGISKKSPKAPTPVSTTIANLEKKISRLEMDENLLEGSLNHSELLILRAKLEKRRNSL